MRGIRVLVSTILAAIAVLGVACRDPSPPPPPSTPLPAQSAALTESSAAAVIPESPATPLPASITAPAPTPTLALAAEPTPTATPVPTPTVVPAVFPYTVIDGNGSEVTFEAPPERIVAYDSAVVEILFTIGEADRVVATHSFVDYPAQVAGIPKVGDAFNMNIEEIVALEPDLVYVFSDTFVPDLERAGLKVFYQETLNNDFPKVADNIRMWGHITGNRTPAEELASVFEARVAAVRETMAPYGQGLSIFFDVGGLWTPGPDTLIGEVFQLLKLRNVADDLSGFAQLSPEVIVERNPQVIVTVDSEVIQSNPAFEDVSAVKNGQVFEVSFEFLSIPGPRFVDWIEELANMAYAPLFIGDQ